MAFGRRSLGKGGIFVAIIMAAFALFQYYGSSEYNPITEEKQRIGGITVEQEIRLGLESAPQMAQQYGGLMQSQEAQDLVDAIGERLVRETAAGETDYQFDFHVLADPNTVNAFALPGGQVFITQALFSRLQNEDQLAGILGHEIGHVIARHSAERIAKQQLTEGLTGAAVIASGDYSTAQAAQMIANVVNMSYGRDQELESDELGVRFMVRAGYDPNEMIGVMKILEEASGGARQPEFFSTHPSPDNRIERIQEAIKKYQ